MEPVFTLIVVVLILPGAYSPGVKLSSKILRDGKLVNLYMPYEL